MAGNAAGIAKANAARVAKRERERELFAFRTKATAGSGTSIAAPFGVNGGSLIVANANESANQSYQGFDALKPPAYEVAFRILMGKLRVPPSVRATVAMRVIELDQQEPGQRNEDDSMGIVAKLAAALGVGRPRPPAVIEGRSRVIDAAPQHGTLLASEQRVNRL